VTSRLVIAVTGATGFVGQITLLKLIEAGHSIRALVRNPAKVKSVSHPNLVWVKGALNDDLSDFVKDADVVLHIAGAIKGRVRADYFKVNADGTRLLAQQAQSAGVKRFVLLSSIAARVSELSDYAASKHAGEIALKEVFKGKVAIVRAPPVFGPGDEATRPFFEAADKGFLPVPGGKNWRLRKLSLVYVDDLADCLSDLAVQGAYDGEVISPATLGSITWPDFAAVCRQALERPVKLISIPKSLLFCVAGATNLTSRFFGRGHLTLGKLREFLYEDWSSSDSISEATPIKEALLATLQAYRA